MELSVEGRGGTVFNMSEYSPPHPVGFTLTRSSTRYNIKKKKRYQKYGIRNECLYRKELHFFSVSVSDVNHCGVSIIVIEVLYCIDLH